MITSSDLEHVVALARQWIQALVEGRFEWMERYLAGDFLFTSHLIPGKPIAKKPFIEAVRGTQKARIDVLSCQAEPAGNIIILRTLLYVEEQFTSDLGPEMPTPQEITALLSGHKLAYVSGYRRVGSEWQCFDHHQIGQID